MDPDAVKIANCYSVHIKYSANSHRMQQNMKNLPRLFAEKKNWPSLVMSSHIWNLPPANMGIAIMLRGVY